MRRNTRRSYSAKPRLLPNLQTGSGVSILGKPARTIGYKFADVLSQRLKCNKSTTRSNSDRATTASTTPLLRA